MITMDEISNKIEAVLFFKNEPVSEVWLARFLACPRETISQGLDKLQERLSPTALSLVRQSGQVQLVSSPAMASLIETLNQEELNRDLSRPALETLAIVAYEGPVSRADIDHIRGVNSSFILRSLLIRGLIEKQEKSGRTWVYEPSLQLWQFLGVSGREELPDFTQLSEKLKEFKITTQANNNDNNEITEN